MRVDSGGSSNFILEPGAMGGQTQVREGTGSFPLIHLSLLYSVNWGHKVGSLKSGGGVPMAPFNAVTLH